MPEAFEALCAWFLGVEVEICKIYAFRVASLKSDPKLRTPLASFLEGPAPSCGRTLCLQKGQTPQHLETLLPSENPSWGEWVEELCFLKHVISCIVLFLMMKLGLLMLANTGNYKKR